MPDRKFEFRDWMNSLKLKAPAVAARFGITDQTARHWRSKGVPDSRQDFVSRTISEWADAATIGPRLQVQATDAQFRAWNQAALDEGKLMEDWARDGLDELAKEFFSSAPRSIPLHSLPLSQVADGPNPNAVTHQRRGTNYKGK